MWKKTPSEERILQSASGKSAFRLIAQGAPRLCAVRAPRGAAGPHGEAAVAPRLRCATPRSGGDRPPARVRPARRRPRPGGGERSPAPRGGLGRAEGPPRLLIGRSCCCGAAAAAMPGSLKEETALLLEDYFQHRSGGAALPPSPTAATLRRAAAELERRERPFFRSCAPLARAEPREAAALLERVSAQLEAEGGLNWGRLLALVVFAGTLAAALVKRGCSDGPRFLAAALAAYLAEERGEWLEAHGGWVSGDGAGAARARCGPASPGAARVGSRDPGGAAGGACWGAWPLLPG